MGNFSELVLSHSHESFCNTTSIEKYFLSPKYTIPVFWFALFETKDILSKCDDGYITYYYEVSKNRGLINFQKRIGIFLSWYGHEYEQLAIVFLKYLETFNYSYFILDIHDVLGMCIEDVGSLEVLQKMKSYVKFEGNGKNSVYREDVDYNNAIFLLAGMDENEKDFCCQIPDFFVTKLIEVEKKKSFKLTNKQKLIGSYKKYILLVIIGIAYIYFK